MKKIFLMVGLSLVFGLAAKPHFVMAEETGCCVGQMSDTEFSCIGSVSKNKCVDTFYANQSCSGIKECQSDVSKKINVADSSSGGDYGLGETAGAAGIKTSGTVAGIAGKVVGVALSLVGIAFFLLMLYGGFLWMNARGDEPQAKKAKDIIIDAVIGIIIVSAAGIITSFVFGNVIK